MATDDDPEQVAPEQADEQETDGAAVCERLAALAEGDAVRVTTDCGEDGQRAGERAAFTGTVDRATTDALGASAALVVDGDTTYRLAQNYTTDRVSASELGAGNDKSFLGVVDGIYRD
jgi:hypothetical protein